MHKSIRKSIFFTSDAAHQTILLDSVYLLFFNSLSYPYIHCVSDFHGTPPRVRLILILISFTSHYSCNTHSFYGAGKPLLHERKRPLKKHGQSNQIWVYLIISMLWQSLRICYLLCPRFLVWHFFLVA